MEQELEIVKKQELAVALAEADHVLMKNYQYDLPFYPVIAPSEELLNLDVARHIRLFKIDRIAYDKNEDNLAKLSNVYNALSAVGGSVILIVDSEDEYIDFYIGTKTEDENDIHVAFKTLEKSLSGNFPGCVIKNLTRRKIQRVVENIFEYRDDSSMDENRIISSVSGISSIRNIAGNKGKQEFTQGIEKLIDAMRGESYTVVLIADPVPQWHIDEIRKGYEQLYTKLTPFAGAELSLGYNSGKTLSDTLTKGVSDTVSKSLTLSQSHSHSSAISRTKSRSATGGISFFVNLTATGSSSRTNTASDTRTTGRTENEGTSRTDSFSLGITTALTEGESRSMQIRTEEKSVSALIERIDTQLQRLTECGDLGMWNTSAYFIADDLQTSKAAASTYQALIRGENSGLEAITINTWCPEGELQAQNNYQYLSQYLRKLHHPQINIGDRLPVVTPTALISGAELTIQAGLPQKSIPGLAVAHYAAFGREIQSHDANQGSVLSLGNVYHMGVKEHQQVLIDRQSLTAHTFVTGSTGAGKSNAVYQMLHELDARKVPFLVIEPAKGEYKHIFGMRPDVHVFGTNPKKMALLKIDPFRFPTDIHVLEHIDRLIEIFNVCWPMYAAMPAVLKDALVQAYQVAGWDLDNSENEYTPAIYPTFEDVLSELRSVIDSSDYSAELKGNYTGALVTRVKSLTTGIFGQIFVSDEVDNQTLFDENTIVDLSRVASAETKALVMGILVMRLQERRMSEGGMNRKLRHVTVLEEAHHLLKRTSSEQSSEGANLLGKSVEMLSQSIAEMRTYGEGFIIADQSPNMLDMSVIRNTNTKIILRLPALSDRELCGKAAGLDDEQVVELAKLPTGVAAVYQNNWIEPVLCNINRFSAKEEEYAYKPSEAKESFQDMKRALLKCLLAPVAGDMSDHAADELSKQVIASSFSARTKRCLLKALNCDKKKITSVCEAVSTLFHTEELLESASKANDLEQWNQMLLEKLKFDFNSMDPVYSKLVLQCILKQKSLENPAYEPYYSKWHNAMKGGSK